MNHHPIIKAAIFFTAFAVIPGCTTVNNVGPSGTGQINGSVSLKEMDCSSSASSAGVNVQILETGISTVSDSAGNFTLDGVPAGYYTLHFFKPGYSEYYTNSLIEFVGGGTLYLGPSADLSRSCNWTTTLSTPKDTLWENNYYLLNPSDWTSIVDSTGKNLTLTQINRARYYFSHKPNINYLDTNTYYGSMGTYDIINSGNAFAPGSDKGDTLYILAILEPCISIGPGAYYVGDTVKTWSNAPSPPSETIQFVLR